MPHAVARGARSSSRCCPRRPWRTSSLDIWETEYLHVLTGVDPVKEWVKGTWLRPLLDALDEAERPAFEERYAEMLRVPYPPRADGRTLFRFRRLFIVATARS
jgi:trans-aconitate 2-methyltransferase